MNPRFRELLAFCKAREPESFSVAGRIDERRFLPRTFPTALPVLFSYQVYPTYSQMVGENWMHWHDYYECWIALGGSGEFRSGNHGFAFSQGDIVLVDPLKIHGVQRMETGHAPLVLFFRTEAVAPTNAEVDLAFLAAFDRRPENVVPRLAAEAPGAGAVHGSMLRLVQAWSDDGEGETRLVRMKFHLLELLLELRRAFSAEGNLLCNPRSLRLDREAKLGRVLDYVAERCHGAVSQPEVARIAGMSTSRFRIFFKETTGWGFSDYLRDLRLERAAQLLRESAESVASVAYQTGFADQSHLQRLFKEKYTISPLAYRKHHLLTDDASE